MPEESKTVNFLMKCWLITIQNIVGPNGLNSVLNYAHLQKYIDNFPPDNELFEIPVKDARDLFHSLYELFGSKGSRSLSFRVGREYARIGIDGRPAIVKALMLAARLVPEKMKMRLALDKLVETENMWFRSNVSGPIVELKEEGNYFYIVRKDWFESGGIVSQQPVCGMYSGMLQYIMKWITGHEHDVEEIECKAVGDSVDVFRIEKARKEKS